MLVHAVCTEVFIPTLSLPCLPHVLTFSPHGAATLSSDVSCFKQPVYWTLAGKYLLPRLAAGLKSRMTLQRKKKKDKLLLTTELIRECDLFFLFFLSFCSISWYPECPVSSERFWPPNLFRLQKQTQTLHRIMFFHFIGLKDITPHNCCVAHFASNNVVFWYYGF